MRIPVQKFTASLRGTEHEVWGVHLQTKFANQARTIDEWHTLLRAEHDVPVETARPQPVRGPVQRLSGRAVRHGPFALHALHSGRR